MVAESFHQSSSFHSNSGSSLEPAAQRLQTSLPLDELLARAKQGQSQSLGTLLQWYNRYLTILASNRLDGRIRRRVSPSDIVQETLLAAHRDFQGFRGGSQGELVAWLRQILIHSLHRHVERHLKTEKRDVRRDVPIDGATYSAGDGSVCSFALSLPAMVDSPSADIRRKESREAFNDRLVGLSEAHRQVIRLRIVEGLSFQEIARRMGRSSGAVRMLWLRGLAALKNNSASGESNV